MILDTKYKRNSMGEFKNRSTKFINFQIIARTYFTSNRPDVQFHTKILHIVKHKVSPFWNYVNDVTRERV